MMNNFIYNVPTKVYFGENQLINLGEELKKYGNRVLLTYGSGSIKKSGLYDKIIKEIEFADLELFELSGIEPNPKVESVRAGTEICKENNIDVLLAVGGGSVIDCTKFIGAATFYNGDAWDLSVGVEGFNECLPIVTVLTLAATGSEMNSVGVISNPETKDKLGAGYSSMLPRASFLNPALTYTVNEFQTACGAADILNHIMEVYFNMDSDLFMLDTVMEGLMKTVIKYAPLAINEPTNYEARANLMWASSWAINSFIEGGKQLAWSCHPIEHELSAIYDITHGLGLAIITPRWLEFCLNSNTVSKFFQYGVNVFGLNDSLPMIDVARKSIELTKEFLFETLNLPNTLTDIGIDSSNLRLMATKACKGKTIDGFIELDVNDVEMILRMCMEK